MKPLVSIIIPTYNRATTIGRTIESVLKQTYSNYEMIIVEDGSKDDTLNVLKQYDDKRIRVICHEKNKGVTAAKNTGLDNIKGEWFTILDSDDEIVPEALDAMMSIPLEKDGTVTAVSCNCIDTSTGKFSGSGIDSDSYVDFRTLINDCTGEYWGLTKTRLLGNDRFNERLGGYEATLWYKMNERAKRFYVHKALRIYHTEGDDRVSKIPPSIKKMSDHYQALAEESHYLEIMKTCKPGIFANDCLKAVMYLMADKRRKEAGFYYQQLKQTTGFRLHKMIASVICHSNSLVAIAAIKFFTATKIIK